MSRRNSPARSKTPRVSGVRTNEGATRSFRYDPDVFEEIEKLATSYGSANEGVNRKLRFAFTGSEDGRPEDFRAWRELTQLLLRTYGAPLAESRQVSRVAILVRELVRLGLSGLILDGVQARAGRPAVKRLMDSLERIARDEG